MDHGQLAREEQGRIEALERAKAAKTFEGLPLPEENGRQPWMARRRLIKGPAGRAGLGTPTPDELGPYDGANSRGRFDLHSKADDQSTDSEYERLMRDIGQPPASLRKNVPLNNYQAKMPKVFKQDELYDIKNLDVAEEKQHLTLLEVSPDIAQNIYVFVPKPMTPKDAQRQRVKSPDRGGIRLCRVIEDARLTGQGFPLL